MRTYRCVVGLCAAVHTNPIHARHRTNTHAHTQPHCFGSIRGDRNSDVPWYPASSSLHGWFSSVARSRLRYPGCTDRSATAAKHNITHTIRQQNKRRQRTNGRRGDGEAPLSHRSKPKTCTHDDAFAYTHTGDGGHTGKRGTDPCARSQSIRIAIQAKAQAPCVPIDTSGYRLC